MWRINAHLLSCVGDAPILLSQVHDGLLLEKSENSKSVQCHAPKQERQQLVESSSIGEQVSDHRQADLLFVQRTKQRDPIRVEKIQRNMRSHAKRQREMEVADSQRDCRVVCDAPVLKDLWQDGDIATNKAGFGIHIRK